MKKLANIVYGEDLVNHTVVDTINYYKDTIDGIDYNLPTLFVGWNYFKHTYIGESNANILENEIVKNRLYWEFSFHENKSQHVLGIDKFIKESPYYYFTPKYSYTNLDPVMFNISGITELLEILPSKPHKTYNYKNEMLYVLFENKIIGLDLVMYQYFDFEIESIIITLQNNSIDTYIDLDGIFYQNHYKSFPNFDNLKRYMVVLMSNS